MAHFPLPQQSQTFSYRERKSFILEETHKKHLIRTDAEIEDIANTLHPATAGNLLDENT